MTFDFQPTLSGETLLVRPLARSDFDALYAVAADPLVWEQHPASDRWQLPVFTELFERLLQGGGGLVVIERASGQIIGSSSYYELDAAARSVVIGYTFLARRCWGGKVNAELKSLMLTHAFRHVDRVWFHVGTGNFRSQRAMQKVGATLSHQAVRESGGVTSAFLHYFIDRETHQHAEQAAQWQRNKYSLFVDLGLGALFFVLAKATDDLTLAALVTAGAGLAVVVVQRFVKVDLLGGLAMFGVAMLLVSAGFSWFFADDWAVKMKSTILGIFVATLTLGDAVFNRGRYFGGRLLRYMPQPLDARRLATGLGLLGLVMAAVNWLFAEFTSKDTWLYYTSFGDFLLSMALVFAVLHYARIDRND